MIAKASFSERTEAKEETDRSDQRGDARHSATAKAETDIEEMFVQNGVASRSVSSINRRTKAMRAS